MLVLVPVADIFLYGTNLKLWPPAAGIAATLLAIGLLAVAVSRKRGTLIPGVIVFGLSLVALLLEPGFANTVSLIAGLALLAWVGEKHDPAWGIIGSALKLIAAPFQGMALAARTAGALIHRPRAERSGIPEKHPLRTLVGLVFPAIVVSGFFLWLLSLGNAALAEALSRATTQIGIWIENITFPDVPRFLFWFATLFSGMLLFVPALRSASYSVVENTFKNRRADPAAPQHRKLQWLLVLAGVNLVFLLTNTLDVIYLWIRRAAPSGVSSTSYLHEGVYSLIFVTILAGVLLAVLFNAGTAVSRSRPLRILGFAWVVQNVFLIGGVAFRLWLHIENFCLTPRRLGVAFFLVLVLAGFALLVLYIVREKSLRWLAGSNLLAVFTLFFVVQFFDINGWCATSAIERHKVAVENKVPPIKISRIFLKNIELSSWRVVKALADKAETPGEHDACVYQAQNCWKTAKARLGAASKESASWREWSWRASRERSELSEALGQPGKEAAVEAIWLRALEEAFAN